MVTRGYSEKTRVRPNRSRTYDLPITSSDALPLSYRRLVSGDSGILGKNPSTPEQESNLRPSDYQFGCSASEIKETRGS